MDPKILTTEWRDFLIGKKRGSPVFSISQQQFRREWDETKCLLGVPWIGPPHDLRHTGASRDVAEKSRTLEQVRRRGRWQAPGSVARYTKTFWLIKQRARTPNYLLKQGALLMEQRGERQISA